MVRSNVGIWMKKLTEHGYEPRASVLQTRPKLGVDVVSRSEEIVRAVSLTVLPKFRGMIRGEYSL